MIPLVDLAPGYTVPRVIIGGWQLSAGHSNRRPDPATLRSFWDQLLDRGLNTFDCADIYTGVEEMIGEYVRLRRKAGVAPPQVHTKCVPDLAALPSLDRQYVEGIVDRSLARLGVERLDLVQLHWWDYAAGRVTDALGWLDDLRRDGKIRLIGLTNFDSPQLQRLLATGIPIASIQVQHSVLDQRPERGLSAAMIANRVSELSFGTLAGGFLAERWLGQPKPTVDETRSATKYRLVIDESGGWSWFQEVLLALDGVARRHQVSIPSVALRWVLDRPGVAAGIVGARRFEHVAMLEQAVELRLTEEDRATIDAATGPLAGPPGDVYDAERIADGPHAAIMRYDLNAHPQVSS